MVRPIRTRSRASRFILLAVVAALAAGAVHLAGGESRGSTPSTAAHRPNVLVIVTDDQRIGTVDASLMPNTHRWIQAAGTTYADAFVTTPLCCPSRASIMTGQYAHNHTVLRNGPTVTTHFDEGRSVQCYLHEAGYRTAVFGKFLNGWDLSRNPACLDRWAIMWGSYYDSTFNVNGDVRTIPQYSTDYIGARAVDWLKTTEAQDGQPWYLYVAPFAPHFPYTAEPSHATDPVGSWAGDPAVFEDDRSDKPPFVRAASYRDFDDGKHIRERQIRATYSVDDMVGRIFAELAAAGELDDTLVVFISDNGMLWGEHHIRGKGVPYTEAIKVPMMVRWPGHVAAGATDDRLVANIDIMPTILAAASVPIDPARPVDGRPLYGGFQPRTRLLTENWTPGEASRPPWASIRTDAYQYVEYYAPDLTTVVEREYYDLRTDPWQLDNVLGDGVPGNEPDVRALHAVLAADRACAGSSCP